ncbi:unnamed protein product [Parnassius apollo]|uniref:(apollo) hypothetical protein n=1 Tax=Parnassius apollo TaxID=110799 RepID=A0A8S3X4Y8_PARAO|nr:unnamed protein product [Parnassius apollo]
MDLIRDQDTILQILNESDNDDDDSPLVGPPGVPSDSELDDNLEEDLVKNTDESEEKSSSSSDEDLNVSRINRYNAEIELKNMKYKELTHTISATSASEVKALLGVLLQSAAIKSNHLPTRMLFDTRRSGNVFKACMSAERFDFLLRCLRFDKATRQVRRASDKFTPIREIHW